jgi:hypothetical protein
MKSLTIYLHEEDYEKVKQITEERRTTVSKWYRELTRLGISTDEGPVIENRKIFYGMEEEF